MHAVDVNGSGREDAKRDKGWEFQEFCLHGVVDQLNDCRGVPKGNFRSLSHPVLFHQGIGRLTEVQWKKRAVDEAVHQVVDDLALEHGVCFCASRVLVQVLRVTADVCRPEVEIVSDLVSMGAPCLRCWIRDEQVSVGVGEDVGDPYQFL